MNLRKATGLLLAIVMVLATLLGTVSMAVAQTSDLPYVELKMFAIMDAPKNQALAEQYYALLNEQLKEKLNCTIKVDYAAGNDYQNNYQLVMAAGDKYDLIHAGSWLNYPTNALKGAYMDLTDLLPEYAPYIWEKIPEDRWNGVKVSGKIYGVPTMRQTYVEPSLFYREDLRLKYDLPEINSFDTIAAYLQAIKDNEPELLPSDDYQCQVYGTMFIKSTKYQIVDSMNDRHSNFVIDPANPRKVLATIELPEYKEFMYMMKDWADRGFWPRSVLSSLEWGVFSVLNGKAAASFNGQFDNYSYFVPQAEKDNPGWIMNYYEYSTLNPDSVLLGQSATSNMIAITRNADNPERALMLIDLLHQDRDLWDLCNYGIYDVNYKLTADGLVDTSFIDPTVDGFNYFPGALVDDVDFYRQNVDTWPEVAPRLADMRSRTMPNILAGYVFDATSFEAEYTALNQVRIEYAFPLQAGLVEDVDAAYEDLLERAKAAGLDVCREAVEKQLNEFLDSIVAP